LESVIAVKVESLQTEPILVSSESSISEAIGALRNLNAHEAFVVEGKKVSMLLMRDLVKASDISRRKVTSLTVSAPKLSPNDNVGKAARMMTDYCLRTLPVVVKESITGIIADRSICQLLKSTTLRNVKAGKIMTAKPTTVRKEDTVAKARSLMIRRRFDHLPVVNARGLCGILSSSHIVFSMIPSEGLEKGAMVSALQKGLSELVGGLMDPNPLTCGVNDDALTVLDTMMGRGTTYSLVTLWGELQGIITFRDFVKLLVPLERSVVPAYIVGLPDDPFEAEVAKSKFLRVVNNLGKAFPKLQEVRSTVKTSRILGDEDRLRYEANVTIKMPERVYAFSETGWSLPNIYDSLSNKIKRILAQKHLERRRKSIRYGEL